MTSLQEFYRDRVLLITGATGFIGRVLLYKLLSACPEIRKIILLLRPKGTETCADRLRNLFSAPEFADIPSERLQKVTYVAGDITEPQLGIGAKEYEELLSSQVSVAFHVAASVKFTDPLRTALTANFLPALSLIRICERLQQFQGLVIVSTAFSFFPRQEIGEEVYSLPVNLEGIQDIASLNLEHLEKIRREGLWVNMYTFSKALVENAVQQNNKSLRIAIVRPSIVLNAWKEPAPGWINNVFGPLRIVRGSFLGRMRTVVSDGRKKADLVPVDLCVNSLIAVARETAERGQRGQCKVYNYISGTRNHITWGEYWTQCGQQILQFPPLRAQWYYLFVPTKFWTIYYVMWFLLELVPACMISVLQCLTTSNPQRKIRQALTSMYYVQLTGQFSTNECKYEDTNTRSLLAKLSPDDQTLFNFDIRQVNWSEYLTSCVKGIRHYILKEDFNTLQSARNRYKRLFALHCAVMTCAVYLGYKAAATMCSALLM